MAKFATAVNRHSLLLRLKSITLTLPQSQTRTPFRSWVTDTLACLQSCPLESFSVYSTTRNNAHSTADIEFICQSIVDTHGPRIRKFSVNRFIATTEMIRDVCAKCPRLTDLFVTTEHTTLVRKLRKTDQLLR